MKLRNWTALLIMCITPSASANVIADRFSCTVVAELKNGQAAVHGADFDIARRESSGPYSADPSKTEVNIHGDVSLSNSAGTNFFTTGLGIWYRIVLLKDAKGNIIQAKQNTCLFLSASSVKGATQTRCSTPDDPAFEPNASGWTSIQVVNGDPIFDTTSLQPTTLEAADGSKISVSCKYIYPIS